LRFNDFRELRTFITCLVSMGSVERCSAGPYSEERGRELFRERDFRGCAFVTATAEAPRGGLIEQAADDYRNQIRALFTELAEQAGASDPGKLARHLQVIYDGAGLAARMDRDPSIALTARVAAETLLDASL
jgi:hypothetical protein